MFDEIDELRLRLQHDMDQNQKKNPVSGMGKNIRGNER